MINIYYDKTANDVVVGDYTRALPKSLEAVNVNGKVGIRYKNTRKFLITRRFNQIVDEDNQSYGDLTQTINALNILFNEYDTSIDWNFISSNQEISSGNYAIDLTQAVTLTLTHEPKKGYSFVDYKLLANANPLTIGTSSDTFTNEDGVQQPGPYVVDKRGASFRIIASDTPNDYVVDKEPTVSIPPVIQYQGGYDASTNTPDLSLLTTRPEAGDNPKGYIVTNAGIQDIGKGSTTFTEGGLIVLTGPNAADYAYQEDAVIPSLSTSQVTDSTSTTFGLVSGQRLKEAVDEHTKETTLPIDYTDVTDGDNTIFKDDGNGGFKLAKGEASVSIATYRYQNNTDYVEGQRIYEYNPTEDEWGEWEVDTDFTSSDVDFEGNGFTWVGSTTVPSDGNETDIKNLSSEKKIFSGLDINKATTDIAESANTVKDFIPGYGTASLYGNASSRMNHVISLADKQLYRTIVDEVTSQDDPSVNDTQWQLVGQVDVDGTPLHYASFNRQGSIAPVSGIVDLSSANMTNSDPNNLRVGNTLVIKNTGRYKIDFIGNFLSTGARGISAIQINDVSVATSNGDAGTGDSPYVVTSVVRDLTVGDVVRFTQNINLDNYSITLHELQVTKRLLGTDDIEITNPDDTDNTKVLVNNGDNTATFKSLASTTKQSIWTRANAGTWVTIGALRFMMNTNGNRSFRLSATSNITVRWVSWSSWAFTRLNGSNNSSAPNTRNLTSSSNLPLHDSLNMGNNNDKQSGIIEDITNNKRYEFHLFVGFGYNNNVFVINEI